MPIDDSTWSVSGVRVAITGGSEGLGWAMARALAEAGAKVWIGSRHLEKVERALGQRHSQDWELAGGTLDVTQSESIEQWLSAMIGRYRGIDVLVNNAGLGMRTVNPHFFEDPMPFWQVSESGFRKVIETNLTGYFLTAQAVVPRFLAEGRGRIINITMNHATMRRRGFSPYGPSRAGAESLSHIMAEDLKEEGISVNMLLPGGATDTGMIPESVNEEFRRTLLPAQIMGPPIRFLCSQAAAGLTDERIVAVDFEDWLSRRN
ncbi:MAG: SDR family oxidoreductase [Firmicutes bacterium]|nr:SDR family oxidoreductase [Bacillota bacterium]MCL5066604.1 SDR family oxidoreductase [Bacillota bacterium]